MACARTGSGGLDRGPKECHSRYVLLLLEFQLQGSYGCGIIMMELVKLLTQQSTIKMHDADEEVNMYFLKGTFKVHVFVFYLLAIAFIVLLYRLHVI